ncbi:MAG TPA: vitamin K epoxide reductase family protein [Anaerolineales bacterium]|nr:vitamin K epoxide reductase family protein [Anaerolineales bacterium]
MNKWLYRISIALALLGAAVSIYMTVFKLTDNASMCLGNGGCSKVNSSVYAEVYGVPVALIGLGGFAVITALLCMENRNEFLKQNGTMVVFGLALFGFLFTLYLIYVELALIHALCPFCVTSQITMSTLFLLSIIRLARQPIN